MTDLHDATHARIERAFIGWPRASEVRRFVVEVMRQRARAVQGVPDADTATAEEAALDRVVWLVEASVSGHVAQDRAVAVLAADVVMLSAFFQHLDLLPPERDAHIDAIAAMVGAAVHRLAEGADSGPDG